MRALLPVLCSLALVSAFGGHSLESNKEVDNDKEVYVAHPGHALECFQIMTQLAASDAQLSARLDHKQAYFSSASPPTLMGYREALKQCSNGTEWSCGNTLDWVFELMAGQAVQFQQQRGVGPTPSLVDPSDAYTAMGYENMLGAGRFAAHFISHENKHAAVFHQVQVVGTADHVLTILQAPCDRCRKGLCYNIVQSYNDAYSLAAWLGSDPEASFESGQLIVPQKVAGATHALLQRLGLPDGLQSEDVLLERAGVAAVAMLGLEGVATASTLSATLLRIKYLSKETVLGVFAPSQKAFGHALCFDEFMAGYVERLDALINEMANMEASNSIWTRQTLNSWELLTGAQNPQAFEGLPYSFVHDAGLVPRQGDLRLMVRAITQQAELRCVDNAEALFESLDCEL